MAVKNKKAVPLQATTLSMVSEGLLGKCIDREIKRAFDDISARGGKKTRQVFITVDITPGEEGRIEIDGQVKSKLPAYRPPTTQAKLNTQDGGIMFSPDCSENPDQMTLPLNAADDAD